MTETPVLQGMNIVLVGDFNPKIFQPAWFAAENLIRAPEAEGADIKIINPEIVTFSIDWLEVQVTRDRCFLGTAQEAYYEVLRDLCVGTFKLLRHTPIRKMGINKDFHFRMRSLDEWHNLGHKIAPKDLWSIILKNPGLQSLAIQGEREDGLKGYVKVKVEPSRRVHPGVYVQVNDHYEIEDSAIGSGEIIRILETSWDKSGDKSGLISQTVLSWN